MRKNFFKLFGIIAVIGFALIGVNVNGNVTENDGGTDISGYWYLEPFESWDNDSFVFAYIPDTEYPNGNKGLGGSVGSTSVIYRQLVASDNSYEKLIVYNWWTDAWMCTIKYTLTDNPLVICIVDIEGTVPKNSSVNFSRNELLNKNAYKYKNADGGWTF